MVLKCPSIHWLGFSIANLFHSLLFLILHFNMFNPCLFSTLYMVLVLSDISFSLFNLNLIRLHPNLFVIRKSKISCSISFVTFPGCILCGFLFLSSKPSIYPILYVPVLPLVVYLSGYLISYADVSYSISNSPFFFMN